jgi:hypothetical protein
VIDQSKLAELARFLIWTLGWELMKKNVNSKRRQRLAAPVISYSPVRCSPSAISIGLLLVLACGFIAGCDRQSSVDNGTTAKETQVLAYENTPGYEAVFGKPDNQANSPGSLSVNQQAIIDAQSQHLRRVEVVTSAQVWRTLPTDNNGLRHQKFLVRLNNGTTVLVANDLTMGQEVPVNPGDIVEMKGEYIWTRRGGVLHWTHHSDDAHVGGWIRLGDRTYQ